MKELKINLRELEEDKRRNFEERLKFIDLWVGYIKTHTDKEWSEQQRVLLDSQIKNAKGYPLTKEEYLKIKAGAKAK